MEYNGVMRKREKNSTISIGVGAVVFRGREVLLIKRGKPPFMGQWSIPGGGLEFGETVKHGITREVREETGVEIDIIGLLDVFDGLPQGQPDGGEFTTHTVIIDYVAEWIAGEPVAGDDAAEAEFVSIESAIRRLSWDKTRQAIRRAAGIRAAFHKRS